MIGDIREEILIALGKIKGHKRGIMSNVRFWKFFTPADNDRRGKFGVMIECLDDILPKAVPKEPKKRKSYLEAHKSIVKHGSLVAVLADERVISFATIQRDEDFLARRDPRPHPSIQHHPSDLRYLSRFEGWKGGEGHTDRHRGLRV